MNKFVKSGIATAAGVALLMGGAGTLAYWNDTAAISGGTVTAGKLNIVPETVTGTWSNQNGAIANISAYRIVPGDVLTYTGTMGVEVIGDTLQAQLSIAGGTLTGTNAAGNDLASWIATNGSVSIAASGTGVGAPSAGVYPIANTATSIDVVVTINFFKSPTAGAENNTMEGTVNLSDVTVTLSQV